MDEQLITAEQKKIVADALQKIYRYLDDQQSLRSYDAISELVKINETLNIEIYM